MNINRAVVLCTIVLLVGACSNKTVPANSPEPDNTVVTTTSTQTTSAIETPQQTENSVPAQTTTNSAEKPSPTKIERGTKEGNITGVISDSMCLADHSGMLAGGKYGKTDASCVLKCVAEGQKFVLIENGTSAPYKFVNTGKLKTFAGKAVTIHGHIDYDSKTIHVHEIKAAK
jgi:PBP1b-binding outer membrane lipoprotein LpoB